MKNIVFILFSIVFLSCDPQYDTTFIIKNATFDTVNVIFHSSVNDTVQIKPNSEYILLHDSGMSGGPSKLSLEENDSISVLKNDEIYIFYRDSSSIDQIYNMDNWTENKSGKHNYKYTYVIDNELFE